MKTKTSKASKPNKAIGFDSMVSGIETNLSINAVSLDRGGMADNCLSTSSLVLDLITGGGLYAGRWISFIGETGAGKSSFSFSSLKDAVKRDIPVLLKDYEGSSDAQWLSNILGQNVDKLLGVKNNQGKYIVAPKVRYYQPETGEEGFRFIHRLLKSLPDKRELNGVWYLIYDKEKEPLLKSSKCEYTKKGDKLYVEAEDGQAQAVVLVDSLAAMFPEARDEDDESSPMAKMARMFSDNFPTIKTRLASKRVTIVATNQIRLKPMAFGDPRYQPGGEAVKFYPDLIIDGMPVSASTVKQGKGAVVEEPCWDVEGVDKYKYTKLKVIKNKMFAPFKMGVMRIWFEHAGQSGAGIDPVFDCSQYLTMTGQLIDHGGKKGLEILLPGPWQGKSWKWIEFKELVLNPNKLEVYRKFGLKHEAIGKVTEASLEDKNLLKLARINCDVRKSCMKQIQSGEAFKLYAATLSGVSISDMEDDEEKPSKKGSTVMED